MTFPARTTLAKWARDNNWARGAELGLSLGETTFYLLGNCPDLFLVCVDTFAPVPGGDPVYYHEVWDHPRRERAWQRRAANYPGRFDLLRMTTLEAADRIPDGTLDFVYVDADHTFDGACDDIVAWAPKLKPGGWMTGHDIDRPEVRAAVETFYPDFTQVGTVWADNQGANR